MNKDNALTVINDAALKGALVFFDKANGFPTTELYRAEITQMSINKETDCFEISKKFMPKKEIVDRIGEASGIVFVKGDTRTETLEDLACGKRTVYTGISQGKRRLPDGSWRTSSICEYEFDPTLRAMLDYDVTELNERTKLTQKVYNNKPYGPILARAILEYQKVAKQRANTGARLRVIRELVGMPIAFTAEQLKEPVGFGRIVQNTDYILQTPEGRAMATAQALGVDMSTLFGGRKTAIEAPTPQEEIPPEEIPPDNVDNSSSAAELAAAASDEPDFDDDPSTEQHNGEETQFARITHALREYVDGYKNELDVTTKSGNNPYKFAQAELENPNATEETRMKAVSRVKNYLIAKKVPGVA